MSAYCKPRPDRTARGQHLAQVLNDWGFPTFIQDEPLPVPQTQRMAIARGIALPGITHLAIIQDDALFADRFDLLLPEVIQARPNDLIALGFLHRNESRSAVSSGKHWIVTVSKISGLGQVASIGTWQSFAEWRDANLDADYPHDDEGLSIWCLFTKRWCWVPVPSLLDHDNSLGSSLGHCNRSRSPMFLHNYKEIDWNGAVANPKMDHPSMSQFGPVTKRQIEKIRTRLEG